MAVAVAVAVVIAVAVTVAVVVVVVAVLLLLLLSLSSSLSLSSLLSSLLLLCRFAIVALRLPLGRTSFLPKETGVKLHVEEVMVFVGPFEIVVIRFGLWFCMTVGPPYHCGI